LTNELIEEYTTKEFNEGMGMTEYDFANYVFKINEKYGKDVENHACIKSVIEYQYNRRTYFFFNV